MRRTATAKVYSGILNGFQYWEGGKWHQWEDEYFGFGPFYFDNRTSSELNQFYTEQIVFWLETYVGRQYTFSLEWTSENAGIIHNHTTGERFWFRLELTISKS